MNAKNKRKLNSKDNNEVSDNLVPGHVNDEGDSTDSEESVYSGLESEEDSSEDENSFEEFEEADFGDEVGGSEEDDAISAGDEEYSTGDDSTDDIKEMMMSSDSEDGEILTKKDKIPSQTRKGNRKTMAKPAAPSKTDQNDNSTRNETEILNDENDKSKAESETQPANDEYQVDSSDEEDIRNTVGNIPMEWYKEFDHIGYDLDGKKIGKPVGGDEIDEFLEKMDNPNYWRTVNDKMTGQKVVLSDKDCDAIARIKQGKYVDPNFDPYKPWVDFFTNTVMEHPLSNRPEPKSKFVPSKWDRLKVGKLVNAIKQGWIKPRVVKSEEEKQDRIPKFYMIWNKDDKKDDRRRQREQLLAPKMPLPGHEESYNPPPEYLFTEEEEMAWKAKEPYERRVKVIPRKFSSLRSVPGYDQFVQERFERCLDLYMCPRKRVMRMNIDPEDLIPKLPKPRDLMPFPTVQSLKYEGHTGFVRSISVCPTGQWLASGSDDGTVRLWEVQTTRCMKTIRFYNTQDTDATSKAIVRCIAWNPNPALSLLAVALNNEVIIINTGLGDKLVISGTDDMVATGDDKTSAEADDSEKKVPVSWESVSKTELSYEEGFRVKVTHPKPVSQITWHGRGDYFAATLKDGGVVSVLIHQLSKRRSQNPFSKPKGLVQCVLFHPTRPFFFVATQRYVRVYNLLKQELSKKLLTNVKWVSSMAVHSGGDHVIIGSYDCRLSWFDLDLSAKPYKTLRHHKKAIRHVTYHKRYPLFASASDDGTVIICHGQVYNDLLKNPLIVPVKILRGHQIVSDLGVLCCEFHPTQPWLFSSGADNTIRLFT